jgi:hypothetical protein
MQIYEIEQYELCVTKYQVGASSEAAAIAKLLSGGAEAMDNSHEFIEVADDFGMPVGENRELADELRELGVSVGDDVICSIRSIEEIG